MSNMSLNRREFLRLGALGTLSLGMSGMSSCSMKQKPNIVLIMADDMGYSDLGCYGSEIQTPNLDKLAANGLRFTHFYNAARCCPTRASLMTGLYPHQAGVGWMTVRDQGREGYRGELNDKCVTIAQVLKQDGYGTYMSGKWHLTSDARFEQPWKTWPRQRGFDHYFGTLNGSGSYFTPETLTRENDPVKPQSDFYYTDAIADNAAEYIQKHNQERPNDPFFLYTAFTAPHWPLHAKPEDIAKYENLYLTGWDELRSDRYDRMKAMGIINEEWCLSEKPKDVQHWNQLDETKKKLMAKKMAVYAAQIDCMDQGIGRIINALQETGQLENTLLLFLSDNGASHELGIWGFDRKESGLRVLGSESSFSSYGESWANASNTPFRYYKTFAHEGGISAPLIVHWPAKVAANSELRHQPAHLIDIMATCVDVSGAKYPKVFKGNDIIPPEGVSLVPAFNNKQLDREALYWEHKANRAIRVGNWKLVAHSLGHNDFGEWELYDMENDRTESKNLSAKYPDRVQEMAEMWRRWAKRTHVLPLDGRSWHERLENPVLEF